jgi:predicted GNAT family N-acyltransferase
MQMQIRRALLSEILPLREEVMIRGTARTSPAFEGDQADSTLHFGTFDDSGQCLGCLSLMRADVEDVPAYQLRGMAVEPAQRRRGIGRDLVEAAVDFAGNDGQFGFWCNAREPAVPFYESIGWRRVGDWFDIEGVGPHHRMVMIPRF